MSDRLKKLSEAGVSIWLDDLSRERIETGNLAELIKADSVVGVTTNPSIFANALSEGERYDEQVRRLGADGADIDRVVFEITTTDVRDACDIMRPTYDATGGVDGRVSIEVPPAMAHDTEASVAEAKRLWHAVDRPNAYIKIPATAAGLPAISAVLADGIDVNVTLIFGLARYAGVMDAYFTGLEQAQANGHSLADLHSVASFFVSRVDVEVDKRLDALGDRAPAGLKGKAGIANARIAYQHYEQFFSGERWERLRAAGANTQRPLWASTGVKNPDYDDTMYVTELTVADTVNTMPEKTMRAVADHAELTGDQVHSHYEDAAAVLAGLAEAGIDYDDVIETLEKEGIEKFDKAWANLEQSVRDSLAAAAR